MAAPMAASVGAPLLAPIADTLRAVGGLREALGRRVNECLVRRLEAFIDEDLASVTTMRVGLRLGTPWGCQIGSLTWSMLAVINRTVF
jgi:hypothetical protein